MIYCNFEGIFVGQANHKNNAQKFIYNKHLFASFSWIAMTHKNISTQKFSTKKFPQKVSELR